MAKRSALGGIMCFAAGCLIIVLAIMRPGRNVGQIGLGGVLVALGLFWLGPRRRAGKRDGE
jgi:hypothetical protein